MKGENQKFKMPTVGRIVHFYPNKNDSLFKKEGPFAAVVTDIEESGDCRLSVYTGRFSEPVTIREDVKHETNQPETTGSYWAWPPIN